MRASTPPPGPDDLLPLAEPLQALARRLLRDWHAAEDVAQDALVAAWSHPSRRPRSRPGWLAAITKNLAAQHRRAEVRRRRREGTAAGPGDRPSASEVAERVEARRTLLDAVDRLATEDRTLIHLRYFEDLPPRQIARKLGSSSSVISARLQRALARLRADLRRRDPRAGRDSLVLLVGRSVELGPFVPVLAGCLLFGAVVGTIVLVRPAPPAIRTAAAPMAELDRAGSEQEDAGPPSAREDVSSSMVPDHVESRRGEGWVWLAGAPAAGAEVKISANGAIWTTVADQEGRFGFEAAPKRFDWIRVDHPGGHFDYPGMPGPWPVGIVLRPRFDIEVRIEEEGSRLPMPGVKVELLENTACSFFEYSEGEETRILASGETDAQGKFLAQGGYDGSFELRAKTPDGRVFFEEVGYGSTICGISVPATQQPTVQVVGPDGRGWPGLRVYYRTSFPWWQGATDASGRVLLQGERPPASPEWDQSARATVVCLPNGRFWHAVAGPTPSWSDRVTTLRPTDQEVEAVLSREPPAGSWIEGRRSLPDRPGWPQDEDTLQAEIEEPEPPREIAQVPWTRLHAGQRVALDHGWTGDDLRVEARLMPAGMVYDKFPVENGLARVSPPDTCEATFVWEGEQPTEVAARLWPRSSSPQPHLSGQVDVDFDEEGRQTVQVPRGWYAIGGISYDSKDLKLTEPETEVRLRPRDTRTIHVTIAIEGQRLRGGLLRAGRDVAPILPSGEAAIEVPRTQGSFSLSIEDPILPDGFFERLNGTFIPPKHWRCSIWPIPDRFDWQIRLTRVLLSFPNGIQEQGRRVMIRAFDGWLEFPPRFVFPAKEVTDYQGAALGGSPAHFISAPPGTSLLELLLAPGAYSISLEHSWSSVARDERFFQALGDTIRLDLRE